MALLIPIPMVSFWQDKQGTYSILFYLFSDGVHRYNSQTAGLMSFPVPTANVKIYHLTHRNVVQVQ
jgi:hypothetical protein